VKNAKIKGSISKLVLQAIISRFLKKNFAHAVLELITGQDSTRGI